jgi:hypothetical protein
VGFPTPVSSSLNPWLGIVVYDDTPSIQSVSPTSIVATVPTQITIKGYGFGDHPTVYVGGVAYNVTGVQCNAPTQDSLTLTVTLAASLANSSAAVYVVSNGAGGQAFTGKPLGIQNQRGSATSSTMQVEVTSPPTTITAMCSPPQMPACPVGASGPFQVGATGVSFEIDGSHFGAFMPTVAGPCLANVSLQSYGDRKATGTLDVQAGATAGSCVITLTPSGGSQSATYTINLVPGPPAISGGQGVWYLGTASMNDNCVSGSNDLSQACYLNATLLTLTPGLGGSAGTAEAPVVWSITDTVTGQTASFVSTTCQDSGCNQVKVKAVSQPPYCGVVSIRATLRGVMSTPYAVVVDWPSTASQISSQDTEFNDQVNYPGYTGFISNITLRLTSACNQQMFGIDLHEEFPGGFAPCGGSSGWTYTPALGHWRTLFNGNNVGVFGPDQVSLAYPPGYYRPDPQCPGKPLTGQCIADPMPFQLSNQANASAAQFIFVGSQDVQTPGKYFTTAPNWQVRYTDHGRDESGTWRCPGQ